MNVPWYVYVIALVAALPFFVLWGVGAYMLLRLLLSWDVVGEGPKGRSKQGAG